MSQENVEVVKRAVNAFNRRDLDGFAELGTPDIEWITSMGARDLGDRVLMLGRVEGRGKSSGVPVNMPLAQVYDFRDGKVCRIRSYLDHAEALKTVGLEE
jgi:ketosteroid isomerase-like protein